MDNGVCELGEKKEKYSVNEIRVCAGKKWQIDCVYLSSVKKAEGSTSGTLISFLFSAKPP